MIKRNNKPINNANIENTECIEWILLKRINVNITIFYSMDF